MLEQEWMDKIYNIQLVNEKEIDRKSQQIQQIEKILLDEKDDMKNKHSKLMTDLNAIALVICNAIRNYLLKSFYFHWQENEHLEEKIGNLTHQVTHLTESNGELRKQLEHCQTNPIEKPDENCKNWKFKKNSNWI